MDANDAVFVKELLEDFVEKTGSEGARGILDDFANAVKKLVKVFPYEYQRALKDAEIEAKAQQEINGQTNGHSNGPSNGHANGHSNGHKNGQESNGHCENPIA